MSQGKKKIALGLECPLWIPRTNDFSEYNKARFADSPSPKDSPPKFFHYAAIDDPPDETQQLGIKNLKYAPRPWSAGAGASAAMTGLAFVVRLFAKLKEPPTSNPIPLICTNPADWHEGDILVWEAFVSDSVSEKAEKQREVDAKSRKPKAKKQHDVDAAQAGSAFRLILEKWAVNLEKMPNFFLETDNDSSGGRSFAYTRDKRQEAPGEFISLLELGLRAAGWPNERIKSSTERPPLVIRTKKPLFETIIWDWNGTLLDDADINRLALNGLMKRRNLEPLSLDEYREIFSFPVINFYTKAGFDFSKETLEAVSMEYHAEYWKLQHDLALNAGAHEVLSAIKQKGLRQYILSTAETEVLRSMAERFKISHLFDGFYGTDDLCSKGKLETGKRLIAKNRLNPRTALLIGDTLHDAEVAENLGIHCVLFSGGHNPGHTLSAKGQVIDSLTEVIALIEKFPIP